MRRFTLLAGVLAMGLLSAPSWAKAPEDGKGPAAGQRGQRAAGQARPGGPGERDPAQMATMMLKRFDKDGDQKLDTAELTALLTSMRGRRGGQGQAGQGPAGKGQAGQGQGQRKRPGAARGGAKGAGGQPGGQRPKRPAKDE